MADAENTPTVGTEETQTGTTGTETQETAGTEMARTVWPELAFDDDRDAIDALIEALNAETGAELTFERDVLDVDRPEDWGAVELVNVINEYADDRVIDQIYQIDIWACVSDRGSGWLERIEGVLAAQGGNLDYQLKERAYLHNLKKVMWHWTGTLWGLSAPAEETDG